MAQDQRDDSRGQKTEGGVAVAEQAQKTPAKLARPAPPVETAPDGWKELVAKLPADFPAIRTAYLVVEELDDKFVVDAPTKMMYDHFAVEKDLTSDGVKVSCLEYLTRLASKPIEVKRGDNGVI